MEQDTSQQDPSHGKTGKHKATIKRGKSGATPRKPEAPARRHDSTESQATQAVPGERYPDVYYKIQERAYWLFESGGRQHGHDLEHWLEAERQVIGSPEQPGSDQRAA
jgi:hypothetical protein